MSRDTFTVNSGNKIYWCVPEYGHITRIRFSMFIQRYKPLKISLVPVASVVAFTWARIELIAPADEVTTLQLVLQWLNFVDSG